MKPYAAVIGVGRTSFREHWCESLEHLMLKAGIDAVNDVDNGLGKEDIDAYFIGDFLGHLTNREGLASGYLARSLGINKPVISTEAACASSGTALYTACLAIKSGEYDIVCVGGREKMSDAGDITDYLMLAADSRERKLGFTFPSLYALMDVRYRFEFKVPNREPMAKVAVKNHLHALTNKYAQFRRKITVDQVLDSQLVADPLRLFDCSPVSDGASALIISKPEISKKYTDTPVYIYRTAQATGDISLYSRPLTEIQATREASKKLFKNIDRKRVNMAEVHDCFTIEEIMALEDIGFCKKGEGWKIVNEAFDSFYDGAAKHIPYIINGEELVVNPRGGLKADGHPVSATGAAQAWSIFRQLRKEAEKNQVDLEPDLAITHNLGGTGGVVNMFLYGLDHRGV